MKKKQKYDVLVSWTKFDIESCGSYSWFRKSWWIWIPSLFLLFIWSGYWDIKNADNSIISDVIALAPICILFIIWALMFIIKGKKYWNNIKDNEQPFDLREG